MQNVLLASTCRLSLPENLKGRIVGCSPDAVGDRLFVVSEKGVVIFDRTTFKVVAECMHAFKDVVTFRYNEESSACAVLVDAAGNFYFIRLVSADKIQVEVAAKLDEGVAAASWSPDGDVCAVMTRGENNAQLMLVTSKMDTIVEKPFLASADEQPESAAVSVGWGKKETQFHASEGKGAAFATRQKSTPAFAFDDRRVRISWRADGQHFVVHFVNPSTGCRDFRVYNRNCSLFSVMEPTAGIGQASTWRTYSAGGLIAATQQLPDKKEKSQVVFFEKNGLRRGEFSLPFDSESVKVVELLSSPDAKLLYVVCEDLVIESQQMSNGIATNSYILVYTTSNYHWYVKQLLSFPKGALGKVWIDAADKANRLYVGLSGEEGLLSVYEWEQSIIRDAKHNCLAVVDCAELLLTPCKLCTPPPPMCHVRCKLPSGDAISAFAFCVSGGNNNNKQVRFATVATDGSGVLYNYDYCSLENEPTVTHKFKLAVDTDTLRCLSLVEDSSNQSQIVGICTTTAKRPSSNNNPFASVLHVFLPADSSEICSIDADDAVVACCPDPDGKLFLVELQSGCLMQLDVAELRQKRNKTTLSAFTLPESFPRRCSQISLVKLSTSTATSPILVAVGLSSPLTGGPLYVGRRLLSSCATSFALDERFLVFITTENRAYFVPLSAASRFATPEDFFAWFIEVTSGPNTPLQALLTRPVERGAIVVGLDTLGDGSVLLEMPRGNIEKIFPRPLLLESVNRNILELKQYRKAFDICLRHRISLNLLYDLNPDQFRENVAEFCKQLGGVDNLNLFILDLIDEDVVETLYPAMRPQISTSKPTPKLQPTVVNGEDETTPKKQNKIKASSKVDNICDLLMASLKAMNETGFYLATLTCYAKKKQPELEGAVVYLKSLVDRCGHQQLFDEGLKHLARLADVNDLYEVALGTYDLDLALTVAERTQKDPREYRQELSNFSLLQPLAYRRYSIDRKIGRFDAGVRNLIEAGEKYFDELYNFVLVEKPKLLLRAAQLAELASTYSAERKRDLWLAYIERLASERRYLESGICALRCELFEHACSYLSRAHCWDLAAAAAGRLGETKMDAYRDAAESAAEANNFSAAGQLYEHLDDYETALQSYLDGHDLLNAYQLLCTKMLKSPAEIRDVLGPSVSLFVSQLLTSFAEATTELTEFTDRLVAIDSEPAKFVAFPYGDNELMADDTESVAAPSTVASTARSTASTARSNTSRSSRQSTTSSKASKSRWRLKVGSPTERYAIMERLVTYSRDRLPTWRKEVEEASQVCLLVLSGSDLWSSGSGTTETILKSLQNALKDATAALRKAVEAGWSRQFLMSTLSASSEDAAPSELDERIRYSPMCFVFSEESKIGSVSSSNICNVMQRLSMMPTKGGIRDSY